jgi:exodeoxyribonuclease III
MKIATWNVNSLRVRLPHALDWLVRHEPDVLVLQETKSQDKDFPVDDIQAAGYQVVFSGQKTFNGVAILAKTEMSDVITDVDALQDPQRRILAATINDVRVIDLYVPNGSEVGSDKYDYKLDWLQHVTQFIQVQMEKYPKLVVLGDFNIAPHDEDVHDPAAWEGSVLVSDKERQALTAMLDLGLTDVFRLFDQEPDSFSWWDYRGGNFWKNKGLRIDLILASKALAASCQSCEVDTRPRKLKRPSDHAPVIAVF